MTRDLVCFSHLRWDFVYQRPNHLMARAVHDFRVFFVEEPTFLPDAIPVLETTDREGVVVVTPRLPDGLSAGGVEEVLRGLLDGLLVERRIVRPVLWYVTPMALPWSRHVPARLTVYDSMDHLAAFRGAPPALLRYEEELLGRADLMFCGGVSLHERMRTRHPDAHCFPSSVDAAHFRRARGLLDEPADQARVARPRIGYAGVIDERIDLALIEHVASARPDWQIVLVGPIAKIRPEDLPRRANIHHLGLKPYADLPNYLGGWDVGWMPFARNEATRYISPTKTPEYLAAGLPIISTSIRDVVEPYGRQGLVTIADDPATTIDAIERALQTPIDLGPVDEALAMMSWDGTWAGMIRLIDDRQAAPALDGPPPVVSIRRGRLAGGRSAELIAGVPSSAMSAGEAG